MSREKRIPLRFLAAPLAFAFISILYFGFDFYLKTKEVQVRADFEKTFPAERRIRKSNHSANALPAFAFGLGILLQSDHVLTPPPEFTESSAQFRKVWDELNHYVKAEALVIGAPVAVPAETKQFLQTTESYSNGVIQFLNDEDPPQWNENPAVQSNFIPALIAVIRLHHTLAAKALYLLETGKTTEADQALLACWKLNESLRNRGEPIAIVVAIKCSSIEIGLLKKLPSVSLAWKGRMNGLDYRKHLTEALVLESGRLFDALNEESRRRELMAMKYGRFPDWLKAPAFTLMDPYIRLSRVNYLSSEMELLRELRKGKPVRISDGSNFLSYYGHDYDSINSTLSEFEESRRGL